MAYTTYHSLTGPQGRSYRGYQGTRYETPLAPRSTFETRGAMPMAAESADEVAKKEASENPSPVDAIRELAMKDGGGQQEAQEAGGYTPQSPFAEAMQREAFGDYGLTGIGVNAGLNTALALNAGVDTGAAIRHGVNSTVAAPASALGLFADLAPRGVAADQVKKSQYGDILGGYTKDDIAEHENLRDIDESAVDAGVSFTPAPADADMFNAYEDAREEVANRSKSLMPGLSMSGVDPGQVLGKLAGVVTGTPTQTVFDDVVLPERYQKLLGMSENRGGDSNGPGVRGMTEQDVRDAFSPSSIRGYDSYGNKVATGPSVGPERSADAIAAQAAYDRANGLAGGDGGRGYGGGGNANDFGGGRTSPGDDGPSTGQGGYW